jgi:hypothetical protein
VMVDDNGVAHKRVIRMGEKDDTRFELLSGVNPGEMVLTEGNYDLKDGTIIEMAGDKK